MTGYIEEARIRAHAEGKKLCMYMDKKTYTKITDKFTTTEKRLCSMYMHFLIEKTKEKKLNELV